jgi:hypothetical protein
MVLINFAHPVNAEQLAQIEALLGRPVDRVLEASFQLEVHRPFGPQVRAVVSGVSLGADDWQSLPLVLNLPGLAPAAALVLAEVHGRCGYFPAVVRMRSVPGAVPPRFEVAEVLDVQAVRDAARKERAPTPRRAASRPRAGKARPRSPVSEL